MATVLNEGFEAAGYDNPVWTEGATGGSTVNEDESTVNAGSPPLWGAQCLLIDRVASTDSYSFANLAAPGISFSVFEFRFSALTLPANGDSLLISAGLDTTVSDTLWVVQAERDGGVNYLVVRVDSNGSGVFSIVFRRKLALNRTYRVEVKWDTTNDQWSLWVDGGLYGSGALTDSAATTPLDTFLLGATSSYVGSGTFRFDRVLIDDANHIGPDAPGPLATRSGRLRHELRDEQDEGHFNELDVRNWYRRASGLLVPA